MREAVKTLIVDDSEPIRTRLMTMLSEIPGVEVVGHCHPTDASFEMKEG